MKMKTINIGRPICLNTLHCLYHPIEGDDMEFIEIIRNRYATKKFDGRQVPEDRVAKLKEMIRLAPSSFNIQPWKIKVITDKETKEKLLPVSYNQPQVTTCSHLLVFCANTDIEGLIDRLQEQ